MSDRTGIEWTDATWNPIRARDKATGKLGWHCEHVSEGCRNCYAERDNVKRFGTRMAYKPDQRDHVDIFLDERMLTKPMRWRKPRKIFVGSMTDLFADFVTDDMLDRIFAVMALCPQHTFQVLTKRPKRMRAWFDKYDAAHDHNTADRVADAFAAFIGRAGATGRNRTDERWSGWPVANVWLGVSVEDQRAADDRIPDLLATPAAVRFISAEPLLGAVDLTAIRRTQSAGYMRPLDGRFNRIDWVIAGGESGPGARPMHPDWARSLRDQCQAAGVAFFFKQWGEWCPGESIADWRAPGQRTETGASYWNGEWRTERITPRVSEELHVDDEPDVWRVGKRAAGRTLDGRIWDQFPSPSGEGQGEG